MNNIDTVFTELHKNSINEAPILIDKKFIIINRTALLVIFALLAYSNMNLLNMVSVTGKDFRSMIFPFVILVVSFFAINKVFGYKLLNTTLIIGSIFYGFIGYFVDHNKILLFSIASLCLVLFVYNIIHSKLYGLSKIDTLLIKIK